jgi:hypothetical protein
MTAVAGCCGGDWVFVPALGCRDASFDLLAPILSTIGKQPVL